MGQRSSLKKKSETRLKLKAEQGVVGLKGMASSPEPGTMFRLYTAEFPDGTRVVGRGCGVVLPQYGENWCDR